MCEYERDYEDDLEINFANPGSALQSSSPNNPRNLPCPNCGDPNVLTPEDVLHHYQCDRCAYAIERGY